MCSSAVELSPDLNRPGDVANHLEYHPQAPRGRDATTSCDQVEEVRFRATPEAPKSFLEDQRQVRELCCCQRTFVAPVPL